MKTTEEIQQAMDTLDNEYWVDPRKAFNGMETLAQQLLARVEELEMEMREVKEELSTCISFESPSLGPINIAPAEERKRIAKERRENFAAQSKKAQEDFKYGDKVKVVRLGVKFPFLTISEQAFQKGWIGKVIEVTPAGVFVQFEEASNEDFTEVPMFFRHEIEKVSP